MRKLKWITDKEKSDYMKRMRDINLKRSHLNINENVVYLKLDKKHWKRQAIHGYRIFDFWNSKLGCAIEVDGPEHDRNYDNYRDEYNFRRSGIVVLRVRNRNEEDLDEVLRVVSLLDDLHERKVELGIVGNTKVAKRRLVNLPYEKDKLLLIEFLIKKYNHRPYWLKC